MKALTFILFLALAIPARGQQSPLLRIRVNGKIGFIDTTGKVVIEPRFANVGAFKDGIAPARLPRGLFGYIDRKGHWLIRPSYEFALPFSTGVGVVYAHGVARAIERNGKNIQLPQTALDSVIGKIRAWPPLGTDTSVMGPSNDTLIYLLDSNGHVCRVCMDVMYFHDFSAQPVDRGYRLRDGKALVYGWSGPRLIDSNCKLLLADEYDQLIVTYDPRYVLYLTKATKPNSSSPRKWGIVDLKTKAVRKPYFFEPNASDVRGIYEVRLDSEMGYMRSDGRVIWRGGYVLNIDKRFWGVRDIVTRYDGYSLFMDSPSHMTDWYMAGSNWQLLELKDAPNAIPGEVRLTIDTSDTVRTVYRRLTFSDTAEQIPVVGFRAWLSNASGDTLHILADYGYMSLRLQALDSDNSWKFVQNKASVRRMATVKLLPGKVILSLLPLNVGSFNTRLRVIATVASYSTDGSQHEREVVSNEFSGSVNPAQFWNEPEFIGYPMFPDQE